MTTTPSKPWSRRVPDGVPGPRGWDTIVLGSGMAGLAGILFAMSYPILEPYMGALIGWKATPTWASQ